MTSPTFNVRITVRIEFQFDGVEAPTSGDAAVKAGDQVRDAMKAVGDLQWDMSTLWVRRVGEVGTEYLNLATEEEIAGVAQELLARIRRIQVGGTHPDVTPGGAE